MNSSFFITLIALAVVGAIAYFSAVGFRGAGKIKKVPRNLQKYLPDDELDTTHLDKTLSIAVVLASLLTIFWYVHVLRNFPTQSPPVYLAAFNVGKVWFVPMTLSPYETLVRGPRKRAP